MTHLHSTHYGQDQRRGICYVIKKQTIGGVRFHLCLYVLLAILLYLSIFIYI